MDCGSIIIAVGQTENVFVSLCINFLESGDKINDDSARGKQNPSTTKSIGFRSRSPVSGGNPLETR